MKRLAALLLAISIASAGCVDSTSAETTSAAPEEISAEVGDGTPTTVLVELETTASVPQEATATPLDRMGTPEVLQDFGFSTIWLDAEELFVALAASSEHRQQGLMNITELGALDGMLFMFEQDSTGGFWMKNTLIPLDIAFFDADGKVVDGFVMEPCTTADCPTYRASGSYRYALEMPAGDMEPDPQLLDLGDLQ